MPKGLNMVETRLRDKIGVFVEGESFVKCDTEKFEMVGQGDSRASYIDIGYISK